MFDPSSFVWSHEPPFHAIDGDTLRVRTGDKGDYGRETFRDFDHDDGHFLHPPSTATFPTGPTRIGPMSRSPTRASFEVEFVDFRLGPPIEREPHP